MAQVNLTADPLVPGVVQIMPTADPTVLGVVQVNITSDPTVPNVIQANLNFDPKTPGIVFVNFTSSASSLVSLMSPANIVLPTVTGLGQVGQNLVATNGTWTNSPASYSYQWYRNGVLISGATSKTYMCVSADTATQVSVSVTAINGGGSSMPAFCIIPAFGLYLSTLGGSTQRLLYSLPTQEVNHAKQSALSGLVAATIYTIGTPAEEGSSSLGTGIILIDPNLGSVTTAVNTNPTQNNSNPVWSIIGDFFVYSTTNVSSGNTGGRKYVVSGAIDTEYYAPSDINVSDFSLDSSNNLLMSGYGSAVLGGAGSALFIRAADTGTRYQLTTPVITGTGNPLGDFDPSWSFNGMQVACVRATAVAGVFSICIINVGSEGGATPFQNNGELLIAPIGSSASFWGVPSWSYSSTGTKIISALYDPNNLALNGVYSMNPDGTGISRIALRAEEYYNTPRFVPGGGSSSTAGILYSTRIIPVFAAGSGGGGGPPSLELKLDMTKGIIGTLVP